MTDDFVEPKERQPSVIDALFKDHPETLKKRIAKLEAALKPFAGIADKLDGDWTSGNRYADDDLVRVPAGLLRAARASLEEK